MVSENYVLNFFNRSQSNLNNMNFAQMLQREVYVEFRIVLLYEWLLVLMCVQVMDTEKSTWREPFSDTFVYMDPGDLG